jgi:DNA polymerase delta subunit 3
MLYEFHRQQSSKDPGSVHATYLLTGDRQISEAGFTADEGDGGTTQGDYIQSSPFMSSSMPTHDVADGKSFTKSVTLVHENELEGMWHDS